MDMRLVIAATVLAGLAVFLAVLASQGRTVTFGLVGKSAYTLLIGFGIFLLSREAMAIWAPSPGVAVGAFEVSQGGRADVTRAQNLRAMIQHRHARIKEALERENARRERAREIERRTLDQGLDLAPLASSAATLGVAQDKLAELDLNVQGINIGKLLSALRRALRPRNEMTGHVVDVGGERAISATVRLPGLPALQGPDDRLVAFDGLASDSDLASRIACTLIWARIREDGTDVGREAYCAWADAFLTWQRLSERAAAGLPLRDLDREQLKAARDAIEMLVGRGTGYPEVYLTRANLALIDEEAGEDGARVAEESRRVHAALMAGEAPEEALATARYAAPAAPILVPFADPGEQMRVAMAQDMTFRSAFTGPRQERDLLEERIAASTGYLSMPSSGQPLVATAFVVGPRLIATADYVLDAATAYGWGKAELMFSLADETGAGKGGGALAVTGVASRDAERRIAILHVPDMPPDMPAAPLTNAVPEPGEEIAVVSYPGGAGAARFVKTVTRGTVVDLASPPFPGAFGHDAETSAGSGGAPVLVARTGEVAGIHWGGTTGGQPKLNYAAPLPPSSLERAVVAR